MSSSLPTNIVEALEAELEYQRTRWGDHHDDGHTFYDWAGYINERTNRIRRWKEPDNRKAAEYMVKVAALAIAALREWNRAGEHAPVRGEDYGL